MSSQASALHTQSRKYGDRVDIFYNCPDPCRSVGSEMTERLSVSACSWLPYAHIYRSTTRIHGTCDAVPCYVRTWVESDLRPTSASIRVSPFRSLETSNRTPSNTVIHPYCRERHGQVLCSARSLICLHVLSARRNRLGGTCSWTGLPPRRTSA